MSGQRQNYYEALVATLRSGTTSLLNTYRQVAMFILHFILGKTSLY